MLPVSKQLSEVAPLDSKNWSYESDTESCEEIESCLQQADKQQKSTNSPKNSEIVDCSEGDNEGSQLKNRMIASKMAVFDKNSDYFLKAFLDFKSPRLVEKLRKSNQLKIKQPGKQLNASKNNGLLLEFLEKEISARPAKKQLSVNSLSEKPFEKEIVKTTSEPVFSEPSNEDNIVDPQTKKITNFEQLPIIAPLDAKNLSDDSDIESFEKVMKFDRIIPLINKMTSSDNSKPFHAIETVSSLSNCSSVVEDLIAFTENSENSETSTEIEFFKEAEKPAKTIVSESCSNVSF